MLDVAKTALSPNVLYWGALTFELRTNLLHFCFHRHYAQWYGANVLTSIFKPKGEKRKRKSTLGGCSIAQFLFEKQVGFQLDPPLCLLQMKPEV